MLKQIIVTLSAVALGSCRADAPQDSPQSENEVETSPDYLSRKSCGLVPKSLRQDPFNLNTFYQRYCDANGIPVLSSAQVNEDALAAARQRAIIMMENLDQAVVQAMLNSNTRIGIIGRNEVTTNIPEYSDLYKAFPNTGWDKRTRGLGATIKRPVSSGAEENLLCLSDDAYFGEDIFVHEFAHTIQSLGLRYADSKFEFKLSQAYTNAINKGLWKDTYAGSNAEEYWAEGVQSWFNVNQRPQEKIHNDVDTRAELQKYDPKLHNLIAQYMPRRSLPECP